MNDPNQPSPAQDSEATVQRAPTHIQYIGGRAVEVAGVDPNFSDADRAEIRQETRQQMGIAAADRQARAKAGLPPRVHNLT